MRISLKTAEASDFDKIYAFYSDAERRTKGVYLRDKKVIKEQIANGLFLMATDEEGRMIAGSALYPLAGGKNIACCKPGSGKTPNEHDYEEGRVVELTSVLRMGYGEGDSKLPSGIWRPILFGLPILIAFNKASLKTKPKPLEFDILVANVQKDLTDTFNDIINSDHNENHPFSWKTFSPAQELMDSFKGTVDKTDTNVNNDKFFLRASIQNVYRAAKYFQDVLECGFMFDSEGKEVAVDLSQLGLEDIIGRILDHKTYFDQAHADTGYFDARRIFDRGRGKVIPFKPEATRPASNGNGVTSTRYPSTAANHG